MTRRRKAGVAAASISFLLVASLVLTVLILVYRPLATIDGSFERYLEHNLKYHRNAGVGNILNLCAVSVPCGFTRDGLPVGLMVYAKPFQEDVALRVAYAYEQATEWHARRPGLAWTGAGRFAA